MLVHYAQNCALTTNLVHEVTVRHARQQQSTPHHPLFYRRSDKVARLLRGMGDLETRVVACLTQGILSNVISFSPPCAENLS